MKRLFVTALSIAFIAQCVSLAQSQQSPNFHLFSMISETSPLKKMTQAEIAELDDPFFHLVLKGNSNVSKISEIESLLQPDSSKIQTFVVHEEIKNPERPQSRRAVITFKGLNPDGTALNGNVMLSVSFSSEGFSDNPGFIEAMGWDEKNKVYNYYRLDPRHTGRPTWKFRGSSKLADTLSVDQRKHTCFECHINGGPVMKEFLFPWNNWHSFQDTIGYLNGMGKSLWPVSDDPKIRNRLTGAEILEETLIDSINRFNSDRIDFLVKDDSKIIQGKRILKPLFVSTEFNLISSGVKSRLHPFEDEGQIGPKVQVDIPNTFFLNAHTIFGNRLVGTQGLINELENNFSGIKIQPEEYKRLVEDSGVQLFNTKPGDSQFAWLVPEPATIDLSMIEQLMKKGIISSKFVAAVMAIDIETPMLSDKREALLKFIPDSFSFSLDKNHPDDLTLAVIENLKLASPNPESPEHDFLLLLQMPDPKVELQKRVDNYHQRIISKLNNPETRHEELQRLYGIAIKRRLAVLSHPTFQSLDETRGTGLLPIPMHHGRLSF